MKNMISLFVMFLFIVSGIGALEVHADNVKKVGTPHYSVAIMGASYGSSSTETDGYIYTVANGDPAVLNVIDAQTGERVDSLPLEGASFSWGVAHDDNGYVYIAGSDKFYQYTIETGELRAFGRPVPSENYLWRIAVDNQGRVFGGTYPNGKVYMYNPETDAFRDYGTVVEGQKYVRSIDVDNKGNVYAGTGTSGAHIVRIDIDTGEKEEITLPEPYQDQKTVYDLDVKKQHLFARVTNSATLLVYDLRKGKWVDEIKDVKGLDVSDAGPGNKVYLIKNDATLYEYKLNQYKLKATPMNGLWSARDFGWMKYKEKGYPGKSLVSIRYDGNYWIYNPITENHKMLQADIKGEPIDIQSIGVGPDNNIYTSAYMVGGLTKYTPSTEEFERYSGNGQTEGMISTDNYLYLGTYPGANVFQYNPNQPYELDPIKPEEASNPNLLFSLKEEGQDRPFALTEGDGNVFVGTVPDYDKLGGSLSTIDESSGTHNTYYNIVDNQSIISLTYQDGIVYGGTSIWGGLGVEPTEENGKLFIWDPASASKTYETVPIPGHGAVTEVAFDDDGYLWGITINTIFKFNPETKEIVQSKKLFNFNWDQLSHSWRSAHLEFDKSEGQFYGRTQEGIFRFNPDTWEYEVLEPNASLFAMDDNGDIYFARGTELFRYVR